MHVVSQRFGELPGDQAGSQRDHDAHIQIAATHREVTAPAELREGVLGSAVGEGAAREQLRGGTGMRSAAEEAQRAVKWWRGPESELTPKLSR